MKIKIFQSIILIFALMEFFSTVTGILRHVSMNFSILYGLVNKVGVVGLMCLSIFVLLNKKNKADIFIIFVIITSLFGACIGIVNSQISKFYIAHAYHAITTITAYLVGLNIYVQEKTFNKSMLLLSNIIYYTYLVCIPIYDFLYLIGKVNYFGLSCMGLSFPIFYFLFYDNKKYKVYISILLMACSGKRSCLLCVAFVLIYLFFKNNFFKKITSKIKYLIISSSLITLFFLLSEKLIVFKQIIKRFTFIRFNELMDLQQFNRFSSGRLEETINAYEAFSVIDNSSLVGAGYGFNYQLGPDLISYYVHFSPLNLIFLYGIILGGLFIIYILKKIYFNNLKVNHLMLKYVCMVYFLVGLFGYNWSFFMSWFFLGILNKRKFSS